MRKFSPFHLIYYGLPFLLLCLFAIFPNISQSNNLFHLAMGKSVIHQLPLSATSLENWHNPYYLNDILSYCCSIICTEKFWFFIPCLGIFIFYCILKYIKGLDVALLLLMTSLLAFPERIWGAFFALAFACVLIQYRKNTKLSYYIVLLILQLLWTNTDTTAWLGVVAFMLTTPHKLHSNNQKRILPLLGLIIALLIRPLPLAFGASLWCAFYILAHLYQQFFYNKKLAIALSSIALLLAIPSGDMPQENAKEVALFCRTIPKIDTIFHDTQLAPWILWYTNHSAFVDKRSVYTKDFRQRLVQMKWNAETANDILRIYHCNVILLDHTKEENTFLLSWLSQQRSWYLVYIDSKYSVHLRSDGYSDSIQDSIVSFLAPYWEEHATLKMHENMNTAIDYQNRTQCYITLRKCSEAKEDLQKANKLLSTVQNKEQLTIRQSYLEASLLEEQGELEKSLSSFLSLYEKCPQDTSILQHIIKLYLQQGTEESQQNAKKWSEKVPQKTSALLEFYRAQAMHLTNNKQEAKQILLNLLQKWPYFYNAQQYLKEIVQELQQDQQDQSMTEVRKLISQTKYNEALTLLKKMIQKDNQYLEAHQTIGEIYLQLHNPSQALVHFQTILKQNPTYLLAQTKKIIAVSQLGDWKTAYQLLNPLLKQYQDHYAVREALWEVDQRSQQQIYKELAENFQYESLKQLVEVFVRQEQGQNAINLMLQYENRIDEQNKTNWNNLISQLYFDEGRTLMQNEKVSKGLQYIETSLKYTPKAFEPQFFLATIALKQKKWSKALEYFQTLQKQYPLDIRGGQGIALIELGQGLQGQLQGDYDKAIDKFSQYIEKTPDEEAKATIQKWINNLQKTKNKLQNKK